MLDLSDIYLDHKHAAESVASTSMAVQGWARTEILHVFINEDPKYTHVSTHAPSHDVTPSQFRSGCHVLNIVLHKHVFNVLHLCTHPSRSTVPTPTIPSGLQHD
jgi:hypothetical protein